MEATHREKLENGQQLHSFKASFPSPLPHSGLRGANAHPRKKIREIWPRAFPEPKPPPRGLDLGWASASIQPQLARLRGFGGRLVRCSLGPPVPFLTHFFVWEGSPTKID